MIDLINNPCFNYPQGDPFMCDGTAESPLTIIYYVDHISIEQEDRNIIVRYEHLKPLLKEIEKHKPSAMRVIEKLTK